MKKEMKKEVTIPPLESLNRTELLEMARLQGFGFLRRDARTEDLIALLTNGGTPPRELVARTMDTREQLEKFIEQFWDRIQSQLPCSGPLLGKCTEYGCSEGRHADCLISSEPHML